METARQHRAARDNDGRDVQPCRRHQHARHDLVAVRNQHERVKARSHRDGLDGIRDELAARERILHARVAHRDAIADADGREFDRRAARRGHAELRRLGDIPEADVSRDDFIERIADADQGLSEIFLAIAIRMEQRTMRAPRRAFLDDIASHRTTLLTSCKILCVADLQFYTLCIQSASRNPGKR